MTKQTLSDQFFNAAQRFRAERHLYEAKRERLKALEADLLNYTDHFQEMSEQVEYVGEGTWRVFDLHFSAIEHEGCWNYVCNTFSGDRVSFKNLLEAVAFLAGVQTADKWHVERLQNDTMHKAAAEEGGDASQLTVTT